MQNVIKKMAQVEMEKKIGEFGKEVGWIRSTIINALKFYHLKAIDEF